MAFFGPGESDIVCVSGEGRIAASGSYGDMMKLAVEKNYGVARLVPMRYATISRHVVPFLNDDEYASMVQVTRLANQDLIVQGDVNGLRPWSEICKKRPRVSAQKARLRVLRRRT